jgi:hypothetical protein
MPSTSPSSVHVWLLGSHLSAMSSHLAHTDSRTTMLAEEGEREHKGQDQLCTLLPFPAIVLKAFICPTKTLGRESPAGVCVSASRDPPVSLQQAHLQEQRGRVISHKDLSLLITIPQPHPSPKDHPSISPCVDVPVLTLHTNRGILYASFYIQLLSLSETFPQGSSVVGCVSSSLYGQIKARARIQPRPSIIPQLISVWVASTFPLL